MADSVDVKLDKLAEKMEGGREDSLKEVETMRKVLKSALMRKNLADNPAMATLLQGLRKREASFTTILANKEDLTSDQRLGFFNRRKEVRFILSFFDSAEEAVNTLDTRLDFLLSDEVDEDVDNQEG